MGGRLSILLMKMVVITSMVVRFTLKAAPKKKGLRKMVAKVIGFKRFVGKYVVINFVSSFSKRWSFLMSLSRCYVFHIQTSTLLFRKKDISSFSFMRSWLGLPHINKSKRTANYNLKNQARRQLCQFWALGYSFASPWSLRVECSWRKKRKFKRIS